MNRVRKSSKSILQIFIVCASSFAVSQATSNSVTQWNSVALQAVRDSKLGPPKRGGNRLLDRAMLVGKPEDPQLGFFSELI
jgi:hypothetical protein